MAISAAGIGSAIDEQRLYELEDQVATLQARRQEIRAAFKTADLTERTQNKRLLAAQQRESDDMMAGAWWRAEANHRVSAEALSAYEAAGTTLRIYAEAQRQIEWELHFVISAAAIARARANGIAPTRGL